MTRSDEVDVAFPPQAGGLAPPEAGEEQEQDVVAGDGIRQRDDGAIEDRQFLDRDVARPRRDVEPDLLQPHWRRRHRIVRRGSIGGEVVEDAEGPHRRVGGGVAVVAPSLGDLGGDLAVALLDHLRG